MSASINHEEYLRRWIQSADVWVGLMVWVSFWLVASLNRKFGINHLIGNGGGGSGGQCGFILLRESVFVSR